MKWASHELESQRWFELAPYYAVNRRSCTVDKLIRPLPVFPRSEPHGKAGPKRRGKDLSPSCSAGTSHALHFLFGPAGAGLNNSLRAQCARRGHLRRPCTSNTSNNSKGRHPSQPGPFLRQPSIPSGSPASAARTSSTRRNATAVAAPQRCANHGAAPTQRRTTPASRRSRRGGATT